MVSGQVWDINFDSVVLYLFVSASLLFFTVTMVERKVNSFTVTVTFIMLYELFCMVLQPHLTSYAFRPGLVNKFSWYVTWSMTSLCFVYLVYFSHSRLKLRATNAAIFYCGLTLFYSVMQCMQYINSSTFRLPLLGDAYSMLVFAGSVLYMPIFALLWLKERLKNKQPLYLVHS